MKNLVRIGKATNVQGMRIDETNLHSTPINLQLPQRRNEVVISPAKRNKDKDAALSGIPIAHELKCKCKFVNNCKLSSAYQSGFAKALVTRASQSNDAKLFSGENMAVEGQIKGKKE